MPNPHRRPPVDPSRAVAYLRVSTEEQRLGPEAQRAAIEAWATREKITIVAWHTDAGVSGGSELDDRPGLGAALETLRAEHAGVLVVAKRDRLARDVAVAAAIERAAAKLGARVVSADGVGNGDSPADAFLRTILDGAAAYERALIRQRTKAALAAKRARGERSGEVPFGFSATEAGRLEPHPGEQEVCVRVRELRAAGLSLRKIVAALAAEGRISRAGKPLTLTQVARRLS
jgi:DNA invertase Pin-like site-specific DNA recombinase